MGSSRTEKPKALSILDQHFIQDPSILPGVFILQGQMGYVSIVRNLLFDIPKLRDCVQRDRGFMKVYLCNADGRHDLMVAAKNMRQAAILTGISYNHFREYGHETFNEQSCNLALRSPGVVYESECTMMNWRVHKGKVTN